MNTHIVKERPILMSAPNIQPILEDRKTQTRRIVKHESIISHPRIPDLKIIQIGKKQAWLNAQPGDRLWVKETHAFIWPDENEPESLQDCNVEYRANTDGKSFPGDWPEESRDDPDRPKWRPSIFMPRWASRILLEITAVRVERLQDISIQDAQAEGVGIQCDSPMAVMEYSLLWESINGAGSWDANPWVWVIEFKRIER